MPHGKNLLSQIFTEITFVHILLTMHILSSPPTAEKSVRPSKKVLVWILLQSQPIVVPALPKETPPPKKTPIKIKHPAAI